MFNTCFRNIKNKFEWSKQFEGTKSGKGGAQHKNIGKRVLKPAHCRDLNRSLCVKHLIYCTKIENDLKNCVQMAPNMNSEHETNTVTESSKKN